MDYRKRSTSRLRHNRELVLLPVLVLLVGLLASCSLVNRVTGKDSSGSSSSNGSNSSAQTTPQGSHAGGATRVVCKLQGDTMSEISGLAASIKHPGILWANNDSGDAPQIYAISNTTCKIEATITLAGVTARDVESIAMGRNQAGEPVIWVGDTGDNQGAWANVRLYRLAEPDVIKDQTVQTASFNVTYEDGPRDAEALLVDPQPGGRIWIATKRLAASGGIYQLPKDFVTQGYGTANRVGDSPAMTTDGSFAPDGQKYVIRTYLGAQQYQGLPPGTNEESIDVPFQRQGEAITYSSAGTGLYLASEGESSIWFVPLN